MSALPGGVLFAIALIAALWACGPARAESVAYDSLGRVVSVITDAGAQTLYSYDAAGNRTLVSTTHTVVDTPPTATDYGLSYTYGAAAPTFDPRSDTTNPIVAIGTPQFGTASFTAGSVTYTPSTYPVVGTDSFVYTVQTSGSPPLTASAVITVTLIDPAPIASPAAITVAENSSATNFDPNPAHHPFTVSGVSAAAHGTSGFTSTTASYQPAVNFWGGDGFTYTIHYGPSPSATAQVNVTVTATAPSAGAINIGTAQNVALTFDPRAYATDPQGLPLIVTAVTTPSFGTASVNGAVAVTYTPNSGYTGSDSFFYTVANSGGGTASNTVSVTVGGALAASVTPTTWNWHRFAGGNVAVSPAVGGSILGGQAPYTLLWQYVAAPQYATTPTAPNWLSTQWTSTVPQDNNVYTSTWRLKVTDSQGAVAYSNQVSVNFEWDNHN
ncbi:MAG TPA: Ig-like domain-containing protein [Caulobacteraceae bacterium]